MKALLIPFKDPSRGKTRLAACLSEEERRALAWAMFQDVTEAATCVGRCDAVVIVSSYGPAIQRARFLGFDVIVEQSQHSESESVDAASATLTTRGFDAVLRLPADVPLVRAEDIDELFLSELVPPAALMVASRDGTGTNALFRTPATIFPSRFADANAERNFVEVACDEVGKKLSCVLVEHVKRDTPTRAQS